MATVRQLITTTSSIETTINADGGSYYVTSDYDGTGDTGTVTITNNNVKLEFAPGLDVSADFSLLQLNPSTGNVAIIANPGAVLPDIDIISGTGSSVNLFSATAGEIRHITAGSKTTVNGNGPGSTIGRIASTMDEFLVERVSINSKSGPSGDTAARAILFSGANRCVARYCNIIDSSDDGIGVSSGGDCAVFGCTIQGADNAGVFVDSARCRVNANHVLGASVDALEIGANGDNGVYQANYFTDGSTNPININAGASNNVFTACQFINQDSAIGGTDSLVIDCQLVPAADSIALWLDAEVTSYNTGTTQATDGQTVGEWVDIIGSYSFTEATNKPIFRASAQNGRGGIEFDGTNDILTHSAQILTGTSGAIFLAYKLDTVTGVSQVIFSQSDEASNNTYCSVRCEDTSATPDSQAIVQNNGGSVTVVAANTALATGAVLLSIISDGSSYRIKVNGSDVTEDIAVGSNDGDWFGDVTGTDNTTIGAWKRSSGEVSHAACTPLENIAIDGSVSENTINSIENYLNNKYTIF